MWTCKICDTEVEDDTWEACWHCSSPRDLSEKETADLRSSHEKKVNAMLRCLRCETLLTHAGTRTFGNNALQTRTLLGADLNDRDRYDIYVCRNCGKAEFFVDGVGDHLRGERPNP